MSLEIKLTKDEGRSDTFTLVIEEPISGIKSEVIMDRHEVFDLRNQIAEELER